MNFGQSLSCYYEAMNILPMQPEHADQLLAIYRSQVAYAPHCQFISDRMRFANDLLALEAQPQRLYKAPQHAATLVADVSGTAQGFATLASYRDSDNRDHQAITGLFFADELAAHTLLQACEAQATYHELEAFPDTHGNGLIQAYNAGWDGLSDRIPNVARILTQHNFIPVNRELHLIAQIEQIQGSSRSLSPTLTMTVHAPTSEPIGSQLVQVLDGLKEVGVCAYSTLAPLTDNPEARYTGYIEWLHVHDSYRRRGIARMLLSTAIEQLRLQGCTECWLTTAANNWGAQSLYLSMGFNVVDSSASYQKTLTLSSP